MQWLLHCRMGANRQMRWSPRGAHRMLKVRTAVANGTFAGDHVAAERWARRPFRPTAWAPKSWMVSGIIWVIFLLIGDVIPRMLSP